MVVRNVTRGRDNALRFCISNNFVYTGKLRCFRVLFAEPSKVLNSWNCLAVNFLLRWPSHECV